MTDTPTAYSLTERLGIVRLDSTAKPGPAGTARALLGGGVEVEVDAMTGAVVGALTDQSVGQRGARVLDSFFGRGAAEALTAQRAVAGLMMTATSAPALLSATHRLALIWRLRTEGYPLAAVDLTTTATIEGRELSVPLMAFLGIDAAGALLTLGEFIDDDQLDAELAHAAPALLLLSQTALWWAIDGPQRVVAAACVERLPSGPERDELRRVLAAEAELEEAATGINIASAVQDLAPVRGLTEPRTEYGRVELASLRPWRLPTHVVMPGESTVRIEWSDDDASVSVSVELRHLPANATESEVRRRRSMLEKLAPFARVVRVLDGEVVAAAPLVAAPTGEDLSVRLALPWRAEPGELVIEVQRGLRGPSVMEDILDRAEEGGVDVESVDTAQQLLAIDEHVQRAGRTSWRALTLGRLSRQAALAARGQTEEAASAAAVLWRSAAYDLDDALEQPTRHLLADEDRAHLDSQRALCRAEADGAGSIAEPMLRPLVAEELVHLDIGSLGR